MQKTRGRRIIRLLRNIILYSLAICGLFFILLIIFIPKSSPKTIEPTTATIQSKKQIILVPTNIPTETSTPIPTPFPTNTPLPTNAPEPTATHTPPPFLARCLDVPKDMVDAIATGLTVDGGGSLDATTAQAVRSGDFQKVYFIAAAIHGPGMGDHSIGIWASNSLEPGKGLIMAVGGFAHQFSDWGPGETTDAKVNQLNDGAQDSAKCVRYKQDYQ